MRTNYCCVDPLRQTYPIMEMPVRFLIDNVANEMYDDKDKATRVTEHALILLKHHGEFKLLQDKMRCWDDK